MKTIFRLTFLVVAAAFLAGCATVRTAHNFDGVLVDGNTKPIAAVSIENYGWYLFGIIPLVTGDPTRPNDNTCRFFHDTVNLQNNMKMLSDKIKTEHATHLANVHTRMDDSCAVGFFVVSRRIALTTATITEPPVKNPYGNVPADPSAM